MYAETNANKKLLKVYNCHNVSSDVQSKDASMQKLINVHNYNNALKLISKMLVCKTNTTLLLPQCCQITHKQRCELSNT